MKNQPSIVISILTIFFFSFGCQKKPSKQDSPMTTNVTEHRQKVHTEAKTKADIIYGKGWENRLRKKLEAEPDNTDLRIKFANALHLGSQNEESLKLYQQLIIEAPEKAIIWQNYGDVLLSEGNYVKAIASYNRAIENQKTLRQNPFFLLNLGKAYFENGNGRKAQEIFQSIESQKNPENPLYELAKFYNLNGHSNKAIRVLDLILTSSPQSYLAIFEKARSLMALNQNNEAKVVFKNFLDKTNTLKANPKIQSLRKEAENYLR